jgi:3-oxoacyl-[acyl-carrier-protein] synthase III
MNCEIRGIAYHLPETVLTNAELARQFPDWSVAQIEAKTGIEERHVVDAETCSSDLAVKAAERLFRSGACNPSEIDFLLLCTQSPDYFLPTTACLLQNRLAIPKNCGALDFNLGCSGYVYGLALAAGLIQSQCASSVLLLTAETYTKFIPPADRSLRTIFGDAAAATLIQAQEDGAIGPFIFGTDGKGAQELIVSGGAMRLRPSGDGPTAICQDEYGKPRNPSHLYMNGPEIFNFTLQEIPCVVKNLLDRAKMTSDDIDLYVFHQANHYMLEHLRKKLRISEEKFLVSMKHCGNTVSSTIPIALADAVRAGKLCAGATVMLVGFGVGYSWAATLVKWSPEFICEPARA